MHAQFPGDAVRSGTKLAPEAADGFNDVLAQRMRKVFRPAGAVLKPCVPFLPVALPPLRDGAPRDTGLVCNLSLGHPAFDPLDDQSPPVEVELRVSMWH